MKFVKLDKIDLKTHPLLDEKWVQDRIAEEPSMLGLGDLELKDKERIQPKAGRLDLLLQDPEESRRYEVEVQLGTVDESHIIRTIEYWDLERKRYPQYEHTAVIVAEEITARFLNVIGLFNGAIPLIAIQMSAIKVGEDVSLLFTKVLDSVKLGLVEEDEEVQEVTDRAYWEERATRTTLQCVDELFALAKNLDPTLELKYNKYYIGITKSGRVNNFLVFRPKKEYVKFLPLLQEDSAIFKKATDAGLSLTSFDKGWNRQGIRIHPGTVTKFSSHLGEIVCAAYKAEVSD